MQLSNILKNWKYSLVTWNIIFFLLMALLLFGIDSIAVYIIYPFILSSLWCLGQSIFQLSHKNWLAAILNIFIPILIFIPGLIFTIIFASTWSSGNVSNESKWVVSENINYKKPIIINVTDYNQTLLNSKEFQIVLDSLKNEFNDNNTPYQVHLISSKKQGYFRYIFFNRAPEFQLGHISLKGYEYTSDTKIFNGSNDIKLGSFSKEDNFSFYVSRRFWTNHKNGDKPFIAKCEIWYQEYGGISSGHIILRDNYLINSK